MRFRKLTTVVATAAIAVTGLTACESKIGAAAVIGGHHISDSDISKYLTKKSVPFQVQSQSGTSQTIVPRSYVLQTLILGRLFTRALEDTKGGAPSAATLASTDQSVTQGATPAQEEKQYTKYGFTPSFASLDVRNTSLETILAQRVGATSDAGPIYAEIAKLKIPISVSGRYGKWDPSTFSLTSGPGAGLPSFVTLEGQPAAAPTAAG